MLDLLFHFHDARASCPAHLMEYSPPGQGPYLTKMTLHLQDSTITSGSTWPSHFTFPFHCLWDFRKINVERMFLQVTSVRHRWLHGSCHMQLETALLLAACSCLCNLLGSQTSDAKASHSSLSSADWHQTLHTAGEMLPDWKWQFHFRECNGFPLAIRSLLHRAMFFQAILDAWNTRLSSVNISKSPLATAVSCTCSSFS